MDNPFFVATGEAAGILGIQRRQLQHLFPHILHLYIPKRTTRLWPVGYIDALNTYLRNRRLPPAPLTTDDFAHSDIGRDLITQLIEAFERQLKSKEEFTADEVADLFCIGRMTVTGWQNANVFTPVKKRIELKQGHGRGRKEVFFFPRSELRQAGEWKRPAV